MSCLLTFVRPKTILANDRGNPCDRPRTNEAHAAADGVDQLRKLVQAGPAKKTPDVRSAQVVLHLDERPPFSISLMCAVSRRRLSASVVILRNVKV